MDGAFSLIVFVIICFLAFAFPPYLDAKADPTKFFVPYPAWYFLSLFGLLAIVPPEIHLGPLTISLELIATIIVPTLFLVVVLLHSVARSQPHAQLRRRARGCSGPRRSSSAGIVGLSIYAQVTTMVKQAAAPPSPPESVVLSASAATLPPGGAPGAAAPVPDARHRSGSATNGNGAKVFASNCASCHGAQGQGLPGTFPPLANNPVVTGDPNKVIGIVLNGLHGSISVNGADATTARCRRGRARSRTKTSPTSSPTSADRSATTTPRR